MSDKLECQAPICPFCFNDHSSLRDCETKDLKKVILEHWLERLERTRNDEKQDGSLFHHIVNMVKWL